jgi:nucleoid-associated protein YgaU
MATTSPPSMRGLQKAKIYQWDADAKSKAADGIEIECMFNPYEYRVSKSNEYRETPQNDADTQTGELQSTGSQQLSLNLLFDTYESGHDLTKTMSDLWKLMQVKTNRDSGKGAKVPPPTVAFEWGVFRFVAQITQMTQTFTLFKADGTPVRAKVDVNFKQYLDVEDYTNQNPTSGSQIAERVWVVVAGDRLDTIAFSVYHDAASWRRIAEHNHLRNPLALRPGLHLRIPLD